MPIRPAEFIEDAKASFAFLTSDLGYNVETSEAEWLVTFIRPENAIKVTFDDFESRVVVRLARGPLEIGYELGLLLAARGVPLPRHEAGMTSGRRAVKTALRDYAALLREDASDVLHGEMQAFSTMREAARAQMERVEIRSTARNRRFRHPS